MSPHVRGFFERVFSLSLRGMKQSRSRIKFIGIEFLRDEVGKGGFVINFRDDSIANFYLIPIPATNYYSTKTRFIPDDKLKYSYDNRSSN